MYIYIYILYTKIIHRGLIANSSYITSVTMLWILILCHATFSDQMDWKKENTLQIQPSNHFMSVNAGVQPLTCGSKSILRHTPRVFSTRLLSNNIKYTHIYIYIHIRIKLVVDTRVAAVYFATIMLEHIHISSG